MRREGTSTQRRKEKSTPSCVRERGEREERERREREERGERERARRGLWLLFLYVFLFPLGLPMQIGLRQALCFFT